MLVVEQRAEAEPEVAGGDCRGAGVPHMPAPQAPAPVWVRVRGRLWRAEPGHMGKDLPWHVFFGFRSCPMRGRGRRWQEGMS